MKAFHNFVKSHTIHFLLGLIWSTVALAGTQVLTLTEQKRLEANISLNMMNRLTVTQDRIVNIFGDEGTFVTQADEHTGQVFIKPTPENGTTPLSITLITENGLTQDLTLNPTEEKAATLILKTSESSRQSKSPQETLLPGFSRGAEVEQELWIDAMKQAVLGELPDAERYSVKEPKIPGFEVKHQKTYQAGNWIVNVFTLKNTGNLMEELLESALYQPGDIAISVQKNQLEPNEKTLLYVLRVA